LVAFKSTRTYPWSEKVAEKWQLFEACQKKVGVESNKGVKSDEGVFEVKRVRQE
jgi:hypothetical protein